VPPYYSIDDEKKNLAQKSEKEWKQAASYLAEWAIKRLFVRTDACGRYFPQWKEWRCQKGAVTLGTLTAHFFGTATIGSYTIDPATNRCVYFALDIDCHEDSPSADQTEKNRAYAVSCCDRLRALDLHPILEDSNGAGGFHVWVLFRDAVDAGKLHAFGRWLVADLGDGVAVEVFPKQGNLNGDKFGNQLRLPGKHHKRDHWSRFWDGQTWLVGKDAIKHLVRTHLSDENNLPEIEPERKPTGTKEPSRSDLWWKRYRGDLRTLDIVELCSDRLTGNPSSDPVEIECPWRDEHTTGSEKAYIWSGDGDRWPAFKCHHAHCEGRKLEDLLGVYDQAAVDACCEESFGTPQPSTARQLIDLALGRAELWRTEDGEPWATFARDGHRENLPVESKGFRSWLAGQYFEGTGEVASDSALRSASEVIAYKATVGEMHKLFLRYARMDDAIYWDLGTDRWDCIRITPGGWDVCKEPPVKFRRTKNTGCLPYPDTGGSLELLRPFLNTTDEGWILAKAWLLNCVKASGPYFILCVTGEQGSAKSTLFRLLRSLIDPVRRSPLDTLPKNVENLGEHGASEYTLIYDNVSFLSDWLSDALCRAATGGGLKTRALYKQGEVFIYDICRPVGLNGIPDFANRPDLVSRSLVVQQPPISEEDRKPEKELFAEFEKVRAKVIGALCGLAVRGLRHQKDIQFERLPRMADSVRWVTACLGDTDFAKLVADLEHENAAAQLENSS